MIATVAYALNALELSTQVPAKAVFLTNYFVLVIVIFAGSK